MKNQTKKKLSLSKTTLRTLSAEELQQAGGGTLGVTTLYTCSQQNYTYTCNLAYISVLCYY